jgi:hypothetical protein
MARIPFKQQVHAITCTCCLSVFGHMNAPLEPTCRGKSSRSHHLAQKARWWKLPEKERRISWERCDVDVPSKNARASMASLMSRPSLAEAGSGISLKRESIPTQDHQDRHFIVFR